MLTAITREVSASINDCELSFHARKPIDVAKTIAQHKAYRDCLAELGVRVISLPAEPDLPDAVFVEDPAVVVDEVAAITIMGTPSRRPKPAVSRMRSRVIGRSSFSLNPRLWMEETCCKSVVACLSVYRNAQIRKASPNCAPSFAHSITRYSPSS